METDSSHHNNDTIKMLKNYKIKLNIFLRGCFGRSIKKIFTLDSLATTIHMYNSNGELEK